LQIWPTYVSEMVGRLKAFGATDPVISFGGVDFEYRWRHYYDDHGACELVLPQAGVMAFYADTFVGLGATDLAQRAHVRGGSEELPVAAFLWNKFTPIFRPSGRGPTPHKLAYDPRSSSQTTQAQLRQLIEHCIVEDLWPHARALQRFSSANDLSRGKARAARTTEGD
jgi:hypothetical protein